jgi:hypothetical protein
MLALLCLAYPDRDVVRDDQSSRPQPPGLQGHHVEQDVQVEAAAARRVNNLTLQAGGQGRKGCGQCLGLGATSTSWQLVSPLNEPFQEGPGMSADMLWQQLQYKFLNSVPLQTRYQSSSHRPLQAGQCENRISIVTPGGFPIVFAGCDVEL